MTPVAPHCQRRAGLAFHWVQDADDTQQSEGARSAWVFLRSRLFPAWRLVDKPGRSPQNSRQLPSENNTLSPDEAAVLGRTVHSWAGEVLFAGAKWRNRTHRPAAVL